MAREGLPPVSRQPPECLEHDYGLVVGAFRPHPAVSRVNVGLLTRHGSSRYGAAVGGLHAWIWSIICPPLDCRSLLRYARLMVNST
jgi:hypothetical protein